MDFTAFDNSEFTRVRDAYKEEAAQRWGTTDAYREYENRTADNTTDNQRSAEEGLATIIAAFSAVKKAGATATSSEAVALAKRLQAFITQTQYTCTDEILLSLGEMYIADERFTQYIDTHGEGTAAFMRDAIGAYCAGKS